MTTATLPACFADRPWAGDAVASAYAPAAHDRLIKLQALLYSPAAHEQEARALAGQGFVDANRKFRADRVIIAEHLQHQHQQALASETEKMQQQLAANKQHFAQELAALKPLAMERVVKDMQNALARAGGGGGAQLLFKGAGDDDEEDEDEEEEGEGQENEEVAITADVYGLATTPSAGGAKRGSASVGTALVTPAASGSGAKRMKKAARAEKDELRERVTAALLGGEDGGEDAERVHGRFPWSGWMDDRWMARAAGA